MLSTTTSIFFDLAIVFVILGSLAGAALSAAASKGDEQPAPLLYDAYAEAVPLCACGMPLLGDELYYAACDTCRTKTRIPADGRTRVRTWA